ncbi:MAG: iron-sulfur cluster assembly scaffold protein [Xanthomonadales bacterium]|nr:iron-sulfur cluster assembly scaffold protein [Xanthomonadales bacterium]
MNSRIQPGPVKELTELYRETIVANAVEPAGYNASIDATHRHQLYNPMCGDRVEVCMHISGERIEAMAFTGEACAICMASASLMCRHQPGRTLGEFEATSQWLIDALRAESSEPGHEDLLPLLGVRAYPSRVRCALLPWEAGLSAIGRPLTANPAQGTD